MDNRLLSDAVGRLTESATLRMARMARELQDQGHNVISLSLGEPDFDTPEHIKLAACDALAEGYTKYTPVPGLPELRKAIVQKFKRDNNLDFTVDQIVVSNGAKQTIANIANALLNPGDEAILFAPYWVSYYDIIRLIGVEPKILQSTVHNDFKVTPVDLDEALSEKTKFILFSSPCNPTGTVYTQSELEAFASVLEKYPNVVVVSDEIYEYINFTDQHISIGSFDSMRDRTVTVNGFSKGFSMTGWRLGYMGAPLWLASACSKLQGQCTSGASAFGQKAAAVALLADMSPTKAMRNAFLKRKHIVRDLLQEIPGVISNDPQGAFYIFPNISSYFGKSHKAGTVNNADDMAEYLLEYAHVATVSGAAFGNPDCIRISYAASESQLRKAIERIKNALSELN